ncbi:MAG: cyclase family protein [Acidobacteria bacterium]|nr:cyclase family protein [Acidobacteriota bacterium]
MHAAIARSLLIVLTLSTAELHAQGWQMPPDSARCPSHWGQNDERGSANLMTPQAILRATRLIQSGEMFELADVLSADPAEGYVNAGRGFNLQTKASVPIPNTRVGNEELVVAELGQLGTQFDGFAHQMWGSSFYNCFQYSQIMSRTGFTKLGIEKVGTLMTRGVLIDVAALKSAERLPDGYVITPDDLQQALKKQNLSLEPGDAVLIRTGWDALRGKDNAKYAGSGAGIGVAAAQWLVTQNPMLIGSDNCCVEVRPSEPQTSLPVHSIMLIQHGIHLLENMRLAALGRARAYEFAFIVQPLKLKGATGSTVAPVAIR